MDDPLLSRDPDADDLGVQEIPKEHGPHWGIMTGLGLIGLAASLVYSSLDALTDLIPGKSS